MVDDIWDEKTNEQIAYIKNNIVYSARTHEKRASVRDGNLYGLDEKLIGHLIRLGQSGTYDPSLLNKLR